MLDKKLRLWKCRLDKNKENTKRERVVVHLAFIKKCHTHFYFYVLQNKNDIINEMMQNLQRWLFTCLERMEFCQCVAAQKEIFALLVRVFSLFLLYKCGFYRPLLDFFCNHLIPLIHLFLSTIHYLLVMQSNYLFWLSLLLFN